MSDRVKEGLQAFINATMRRVDWHALYPARVSAQNADGSLELVPDDRRIPAMSKVKIRGLPGVEVKVAAGSRVLLGYEGGNGAAPYASLWDASSLLEITITASTKVTVSAPAVNLGDGAFPVVRYGDTVTVGAATGVISGAGTIPTKVKA